MSLPRLVSTLFVLTCFGSGCLKSLSADDSAGTSDPPTIIGEQFADADPLEKMSQDAAREDTPSPCDLLRTDIAWRATGENWTSAASEYALYKPCAYGATSVAEYTSNYCAR